MQRAPMPAAPRRHQRGAAALVVTLLLVFAMLVVVAVANRSVVVEARASANQYRSAQAFEAAEAGLEWALARLNDGTPIGDDCEPTAEPAASAFRERYLAHDDAAGFGPATWDDAGTPAPREAACIRGDDGWSCACPTSGHAAPAIPEGSTTAPGFRIVFAAGTRPGIVRAFATGCTRSESSCAATTGEGHEAAARLEVSFGLVPGLRSAPAAALTARGSVDAGAAALGLHQPDPASGGLVLHAGGSVTGNALRLRVPAGASLQGALVANDASLAESDPGRFFARWFGMDRAAWQAQPAATRLACDGGCASALSNAVAEGARLLAVEGDVAIDGPTTLGSAERPVVLAATGALRLRGPVVVHGVVAAGSLDWRDAPSGGLLQGAALVDGDYGGDAAADIVHDRRVLARLQNGTGSFARVNGSWKDF